MTKATVYYVGLGLDLADAQPGPVPSLGDEVSLDGARYEVLGVFTWGQDPAHPEIIRPARHTVFLGQAAVK
ncbi:hypothetical protein [Pseudomonas petrae]|uniref:Uncharacterized protein n=1 Tax=Pseudomonas petrae TaxID=2912190 RepID=A0ABS9ICY5_9PSED|nr:hypothetical protein [Pseudomonas petrae]MCF7545282.1 hypothetical protein [Pseudomonas petrae]